MSYYNPPAELVCTNSNCESAGATKEFEVERDPSTGAERLRHEDERFCQDCGHEMDVL